METKNRLLLLDTSALKSKELFDKFYGQMMEYRKNKIDAMKAEGSRRLCLGAGILLNEAIGPCEIAQGPHGKPYIKGKKDLFFNLSHSGDMAVIAVSDREVGADIQVLKHFKESLVNYAFNKEDRELAVDIDSTSFDRACTRMWAMKESVMKYTGLGLTLEAKKITLGRSGPCTFTASIDAPAPVPCRLFICDYSYEQDGSFYGLSVCSEYEDFRCVPELLKL